MPTKRGSEVEVVFGFRHLLGFAFVATLVLSVIFVYGYSQGYNSGELGEPSLFAFLDTEAQQQDGAFKIPDILLNLDELNQDLTASAGNLQETKEEPQVDTVATAQADTGENPTPASTRTDKPKPTVRVVTTTEDASSPGQQQRTSAATKPSTPATVEPPVERTSKPPKSLYYQVAALRVARNAKDLADWLRNEGLPARIQPNSRDGFFRVVVGPFSNSAEAETVRNKLSRDGFKLMARRF